MAPTICLLIGEVTITSSDCDYIREVQGDPNQNFPFLRAISLKVCTSDPMLVKPKLV